MAWFTDALRAAYSDGSPAGPVTAATALVGRPEAVSISGVHLVLGTSMVPPWPAGAEAISVAMGCFWGVERIFWRLPGVVTTAAGYQGGFTQNPSYEEVCTGKTGHAETVLVVYDPAVTPLTTLLKAFWENHDSTTADRQGNDVGSQYRSAIFCGTPAQLAVSEATRDAFAQVLYQAGKAAPTTEIRLDAGPFFYAEEYHQQYLHRNPGGYCNHGPNGCTLDISRLSAEGAVAVEGSE